MTITTLPIPPFYDPSTVGDIRRVPYLERAAQAEQWAKDHDVQPARHDSFRICLMGIDCQNTFCLPDGELYVAGQSGTGAVDDIRRLSEFIYRNLPYITEVDPTMDTHRLMQIFHPYFWVNPAGAHPDPMTVITADDVKQGAWTVNPAVAASVAGGDYVRLQNHARHYVNKLEASGKYPLVVWPYHGMLGGVGHALVAAFEEACFFHATARAAQTGFEVKGGNFLTENYSVLSPEVTDTYDGKPIDQKNARFIERLLGFDAVVIGGEAKSHCVAWTIADLLTEIVAVDPDLAKKVYLLDDCSSAVVVPGVVDYTPEADAAYAKFAAAGMNVVKSTDPIDTWNGIKL